MADPPSAAALMDFAFVLDPLPLLKAYKDTSIAMMRSVAARGQRVFALEQREIYWRDGATRGCAHSSSPPTITTGTRQATRRTDRLPASQRY
jgi:hypothetical protein